MLQNATCLRKSAPWPPNISDEQVSCTALATRNASLQILFKRPTPANAFDRASKPCRFGWFLARCRIPCACHTKQHLNVPKCSEPVSFSHFWFRNVLRATMACTFSTSELPKAFWTWCILCILTSTCASCQNCVHFFSISTSKNGPTMVCFVHFDFQMCNVPQRGAIFHLSFGQLAPHWLL